MSGEGALADITGVVEDVKILSRPKLWWSHWHYCPEVPSIPLPIPCVQPLTLCAPLLACNRRPPWVPALTKSQATWELSWDRLALDWWLAGGGKWKTNSPASGVDWLWGINWHCRAPPGDLAEARTWPESLPVLDISSFLSCSPSSWEDF